MLPELTRGYDLILITCSLNDAQCGTKAQRFVLNRRTMRILLRVTQDNKLRKWNYPRASLPNNNCEYIPSHKMQSKVCTYWRNAIKLDSRHNNPGQNTIEDLMVKMLLVLLETIIMYRFYCWDVKNTPGGPQQVVFQLYFLFFLFKTVAMLHAAKKITLSHFKIAPWEEYIYKCSTRSIQFCKGIR